MRKRPYLVPLFVAAVPPLFGAFDDIHGTAQELSLLPEVRGPRTHAAQMLKLALMQSFALPLSILRAVRSALDMWWI